MAKPLPISLTLPASNNKQRSTGYWGMLALIATEASLFGYLLFAYFYLAAQTPQHWPPDGLPVLLIPGLNTVILLISSVCVWACERYLQARQTVYSLVAMSAAVILGICFVNIQLGEWAKKPYAMSSDLYGSLYFTITGFHMLHVIIGLLMLMVLLLYIALGYFKQGHYAALTIGGMYWHFVDVVWLLVFSSLYLLPYWI